MEQKPMPEEVDTEQDIEAEAEVSDEGRVEVERDVDIQTGGVSVERESEVEAPEG